MRFTRCLALTDAAPVEVAVASDFPRRIGLSASEAAVSLPGDLLVPTADAMFSRGVRTDTSPEIVWRVIEQAFEDEGASRILVRKENPCLILSIPTPGFKDEGRAGTVVSTLSPLTPERTLLHLRRRHATAPEASSVTLGARLVVESFTAVRTLKDIKRAALVL